jgi:hypothetical protein
MAKASDNEFPSLLIKEGSAPSNPASGDQRLYIDSSDHKLKRKSSGGSVTVIEAAAGIADHGEFTYLDATEGSAPGTPASGKVRVYAKTDGRIYSKDDAGVEYGPFDAAGAGGGPLLYVDSLPLHGSGDEFSDANLSGWTLGGGLTTGDVSAVTTEVYDATCLDIVFGAQGDYMYKAVPGTTDYEISLTVHGITNDASNPSAATGAMLALVFVDNSGNGTGCSWYNNGADLYMWNVAGWVYASSGSSLSFTGSQVATDGLGQVMKLKKVGSTITGSVSFYGGVTGWRTATRTDSTTFTRMGIARLYTSGGTNPKLRVGRFNVTEL